MSVVIGYTADRFGRAALEHGIAEARLRGTGLVVVNATSGESYVDERFAGAAEVQDVEARLADCGVAYELRQPVGVDAAGELLAAMDHPDAQLLVVGIRNRNPVGKLLLGSVAQKVILECPKPVLAVKPDGL
ncbi:universal stress protein [Mycobacterium sp. NAZ190054]|uniref:universal stress protein n=1 Tax=Mycobacterium sp. NAZ190054 TaxID=1747766 RepID=UPI000792B270|nr:universal stress protein [Mycobacterium sp. NAZ190054]KWX67682.1 universal stress protein UspA [Mycobacterium sp. NAZ190054]